MKFNLSWMNLTTSMHLVIWRNLTWHKIKWNYIHRLVWPSSQYGWIWSKQPLKLSMLFWSMKSNLIHNMSNFIHIAKNIHVTQFHPCHSYHPCQVNLIHIMVFRMIQFHPCAQFSFLSSWFFFIHVTLSFESWISYHSMWKFYPCQIYQNKLQTNVCQPCYSTLNWWTPWFFPQFEHQIYNATHDLQRKVVDVLIIALL